MTQSVTLNDLERRNSRN